MEEKNIIPIEFLVFNPQNSSVIFKVKGKEPKGFKYKKNIYRGYLGSDFIFEYKILDDYNNFTFYLLSKDETINYTSNNKQVVNFFNKTGAKEILFIDKKDASYLIPYDTIKVKKENEMYMKSAEKEKLGNTYF